MDGRLHRWTFIDRSFSDSLLAAQNPAKSKLIGDSNAVIHFCND
jgi:hypothetical protein